MLWYCWWAVFCYYVCCCRGRAFSVQYLDSTSLCDHRSRIELLEHQLPINAWIYYRRYALLRLLVQVALATLRGHSDEASSILHDVTAHLGHRPQFLYRLVFAILIIYRLKECRGHLFAECRFAWPEYWSAQDGVGAGIEDLRASVLVHVITHSCAVLLCRGKVYCLAHGVGDHAMQSVKVTIRIEDGWRPRNRPKSLLQYVLGSVDSLLYRQVEVAGTFLIINAVTNATRWRVYRHRHVSTVYIKRLRLVTLTTLIICYLCLALRSF